MFHETDFESAAPDSWSAESNSQSSGRDEISVVPTVLDARTASQLRAGSIICWRTPHRIIDHVDGADGWKTTYGSDTTNTAQSTIRLDLMMFIWWSIDDFVSCASMWQMWSVMTSLLKYELIAEALVWLLKALARTSSSRSNPLVWSTTTTSWFMHQGMCKWHGIYLWMGMLCGHRWYFSARHPREGYIWFVILIEVMTQWGWGRVTLEDF